MVNTSIVTGTCPSSWKHTTVVFKISDLKDWMLEKSPIVDRGDVVTILAESDGLRVTVPGRILERGYSGELVRVENIMSKKQVYARVTDHSTF